MTQRFFRKLGLALGCLALVVPPAAVASPSPQSAPTRLPTGTGEFMFDAWAGPQLKVWTYVPDGIEPATAPGYRHRRSQPDTSAGAMKQGPHRFARGQNFHSFGEEAARQEGWRFGWSLREVPGVAHGNDGIARASGDLVTGVTTCRSAQPDSATAPN